MQEITTQEFNRIREYIKANYGISLNDEKKSLIYSRLRTTLVDQGFDNFTDYFDHLLKDKSGAGITTFVNKVTTNHTFFMRESDHFDYLREHVMPYIADTYRSQKDLRLWCCACSSGEESVTLQMIVHDYFKKKGEQWNTQMLATDISPQVLDKAVYARYPTETLANLPQSWQNDYFAKEGANSAVKPAIRDNILYRKLNMMDAFPFKKRFQVIFCRNVMIYFDAAVRDAVVKKFYDVTEPGGYLFIGHSESLNHTDTAYKYIKPAIYRKEI